ncbi:MAG TPA: hypothetical protein VLH84_04570 [Patescibacteria group bacterium]|nr:hypothetical protein [Patescibacteria group bacterium]
MSADSYKHPSSPAFDALVAVAGNELSRLDDPSSPDIRAVEAVFAASSRLDVETMEAANYHSLGAAICLIAQGMKDHRVRDSLVQHGTQTFISNWRERSGYTGRPFMVSDIGTASLVDTARPLVDVATAQLTPQARLVANCLSVDSNIRLEKLNLGTYDPEWREDIRTGASLTFKLSENLFSGSRILLGDVLQMRYAALLPTLLGRSAREDYDRVLTDGMFGGPPISDIASADEIRALDLDEAAKGRASLRFDEGILGRHDYIGVDPNLCVTFDRSLVTRRSQLGPAQPIPMGDGRFVTLARNARLRCPGLYTPGTIGQAAGLVTEMAANAQTQIDAIRAAEGIKWQPAQVIGALFTGQIAIF